MRSKQTRSAGRKLLAISLVAIVAAGAVWLMSRPHSPSVAVVGVVEAGNVVATLIEPGVLRPADSMVLRSPLDGREAEIIHLAPEGTQVQEGDLLVRLDTTAIGLELERTASALRQARLELTISELRYRDSSAAASPRNDGDSAMELAEAESAVRIAASRAEMARRAHSALLPLLERGFITRDELDRAAVEAEEADSAIQLAKRRRSVLVDATQPRRIEQLQLERALREAELHSVRLKVDELQRTADALRGQLERCSIYASQPGLVVYEENASTVPRRKVQLGDRVTATQPLLTVTRVTRMFAQTSVRERDLHRVKSGQPATVWLDAFPGRELRGRVRSVGALARNRIEPAHEDKRFEVIIELDEAAELRPEMTARVEITTASRTRVPIVPLNALHLADGQYTVVVLTNGSPVRRVVQLGLIGESTAEITGGLQAGDRLVDPKISPARSQDGPNTR